MIYCEAVPSAVLATAWLLVMIDDVDMCVDVTLDVRCSPEALTHRQFSEKSDVWSYGVTMWEIFSYGETPKLGDNIDKMLPLLHEGRRLPRPAACPQHIYNIFYYGCWEYQKEKRKSFVEIRDQLQAEIDKLR